MLKPNYNLRLKRLREKLAEKGLDAMLVEKQENYFYLTGMTGEDSFCLVTMEKVYLVVDFRFVTQAQEQAPECTVVEYKMGPYQEVRGLLENAGAVGFEGSYLSWNKVLELQNILSDCTIADASGLIETIREIKDEFEIQIIKEAVEVSDKAFEQVLPLIRAGVTEAEISAELEYRMRRLGAKRSSFDTIVASGHRAALPHGTASEKRIQNGDVVTLDFGAYYKGYCSDMTRTVFVGEPAPELKRIYEIVLKAQMAASEACVAGKTGKQVDAVARGIIADAGFGECFGHGLGHGVGVEIHESPRLSPRFEQVLEDGMAVTIEPGIYVPGLGGVRIEDLVIVDGGRPRVLTRSVKDLIVV